MRGESGSKFRIGWLLFGRMGASSRKVLVENVNVPDRATRVDAVKYGEMRRALLKLLPRQSPGMTQSEVIDAVKPLLDAQIFPGGKTAGWWFKCVQLDLEAKGILTREPTKPLRWHRT